MGDCDDNGRVTVDELIRGVNIALGELDLSRCSLLDANDDDRVVISELVLAVTKALDGCTPSAATPTITPTPSVGATSTSTQTPTPTGVISIADAVARDAQGVALRLGERVTIEGVVTVSAGVFANGKLKIFAQGGGAGIMVYHQTSAAVEAFQAGERLRVTGVIRQADPTGGDNAARGTVLVDLTNEPRPSALSSGNPLPMPVPVTLSELAANGVALTGTMVRVASLHKVEGEWPRLGDRSTPVTVGDDSGMTATMRFQRLTITSQLSGELEAIGNGRFAATAVVVQDDSLTDDGLLGGFQLWPRGADDIDAEMQGANATK